MILLKKKKIHQTENEMSPMKKNLNEEKEKKKKPKFKFKRYKIQEVIKPNQVILGSSY